MSDEIKRNDDWFENNIVLYQFSVKLALESRAKADEVLYSISRADIWRKIVLCNKIIGVYLNLMRLCTMQQASLNQADKPLYKRPPRKIE